MKKKYESDFTKNKIVKTNKMKAGAVSPGDDYDFNVLGVKRFFLETCKYININPEEKISFKVLYKKMHTLGLILFGVNLEIIGSSYYLPYIYYLYKDNVKFKKIETLTEPFTFKNVTFEDISNEKFEGKSYINLLFEFLSDPQKHNISSIIRNDIFNKLLIKLSEKITEQQMLQQIQQQMLQQIQQQMPQQMQQQIQQQMPQQMQQQMQQQKIEDLIKESNTLFKFQNKILSNPFPTNQNKDDIRDMIKLQEQLKKNIGNELEKIKSSPFSGNLQKKLQKNQENKLQAKLLKLINREKEIKSFKNKKRIFNIENETDEYICDDPTKEVLVKSNRNIFFGYDENLFIKAKNGSYKFYYKYSYRNGKFMQLTKNQNEILEEKEINIDLIPTYDILCLYFAVKDLPPELVIKLNSRINKTKENISKTAEAFFKLDDSNFIKEERKETGRNLIKTYQQRKITNIRHKNFGKVKKRRVTEKTYIFFGAGQPTVNVNRDTESNFRFVCFRDDDKVFYYEKGNLNEKKPLYNFPFIYPLEDLIAFILLRRMITSDNNFADIIFKEAQRTIKDLKTIKFTEKITKNKNPSNWQTNRSPNNRLIPTKEYLEERTSLLPKSNSKIPNKFSRLLKTIESF
jgi:hypothetical protein